MRGVARLGDRTIGSCVVHGPNVGGTIVTASGDVIANDKGVARLADSVRADCGHFALIITCAATCVANDRGVARLNDLVKGPEYSGQIISASTDVFEDDVVVVGGVSIPANQNSAENASRVIEEVGISAIADSYETSVSDGKYPPSEQTSPPPPIDETPMDSVDDRPEDKVTPVTDCSAIAIPVDYDFQVSTHFTLGQLSVKCIFPHAIKAQNGLTLQQIACNLKALAEHVLEPIWAKYPNFRVNSAFRTRQNGKSQHEKGQAADLQWPGISYDEYWARINWIKDNINYDQLLFEHGNSPWVHVSFNSEGNRSKSASNAVMTMYNNKFSPGLKKMQ